MGLRLFSKQTASLSTQGFTLIELMIAVGILSITVGATMSLMQVMNRQNNYSKAQIDANQITSQFQQYLSNPSICSNTFRGFLPGQFINAIAFSRNDTGLMTSSGMNNLGTDTAATSGSRSGQRFGEWILSSVRILDPYDAVVDAAGLIDDTILKNVSARFGFTPLLAPGIAGNPTETNMTATGYVQAVIEINLRHSSMAAQDAVAPQDIGRFGGSTKQIYLQTVARFGRLVPVQGVPLPTGLPLSQISTVEPATMNALCSPMTVDCPCNAAVSLNTGTTLGLAVQDSCSVGPAGVGCATNGQGDTRYSVEAVGNDGATLNLACFAWNMRQPLVQCGSATDITQQ